MFSYNGMGIGPFSEYPHIYLHYNEKGTNLVRIIDETPVIEKKEEPEMGLKQWILYFLFLYTPGLDNLDKPERITREEVIAKNRTSFHIVEKYGKYWVE